MWIKICGMTQRQDVERAFELGANAVGFILAPSPRQVTPDQVIQLTDGMCGFKVGVFVNESIARVRTIRSQCKLDIVQLHGDESPEYCRQLGGRMIKAVRVNDSESLQIIKAYPKNIPVLLDAFAPDQRGGTGKRIATELLDLVPDMSRIILAGGLSPENVPELVRRYQPYGIDINSGIETAPGVKDHEKMERLFEKSSQFLE